MTQPTDATPCRTRRLVLKTLCLPLVGAALPAVFPRELQAAARRERRLSLHGLNTGEEIKGVVYWAEGRYQPDGIRAINRILRDWRNDKVHPIDRSVLDLLWSLRQLTGARAPFEVVSGYRSPGTNTMLAVRSEGGVARQSLHTQGKAVDIKLRDVSLDRLRKAAVSLGAGGVGYYPRGGFVHLDSGEVRQWRG
jgi:uncharacterized protein YcbK (DUF882 family)